MAKTLDLKYPAILGLFSEHLDPKRTESASFLIWYLENYYRLDTVDAIDSVCDQKGDKGVDEIYVNESEACIYVFQSRISQTAKRSVGDTSLKEFKGTLAQFCDESSIQNLMASGGKADVVKLVRRLDLITKLNTHSVKGVFLSNIDIDANGKAFLDCATDITFVGQEDLISAYISHERVEPVATTAEFDISGFSISEYIVDASTKALIAPIKAIELAALRGIIVDVNAEVNELGDDFDYRGNLRNAEWIKELAKKVVGNYVKLVQRNRIASFGAEWLTKYPTFES